MRCPLSGRNFEYFSEDPFLNAAFAGPMVTGIQSNNISACVKHFCFNNQETNRSGMSSNVAERVGRELYEAPYRAAVDAGVGSVMCSFNRINTTWSCANDAGLNQWLKADLGFDGFVVSDWGAQHGTADFALGGLDMEQEWVRDAEFYGATLLAYVANGSIPLARLDDMARRVLLPMYALNYAAPSSDAYGPNATANSTAHAALAGELAAATPVLLKNAGALLPLPPATTQKILLVGTDDITGGGGSGQVTKPYRVTLQGAMANEFPGAALSALPLCTNASCAVDCSAAAAAARAADTVIVLVSVWGSEGSDRANLSLGCGPNRCEWYPDQDALVACLAAGNANTAVVVRAPGAVLMPWLGSVRAVVNQLFAGQEANAALSGVLSGRINPAGKLTVSFPASMQSTWLSWPASEGPVNPASFPGTDRGGGFSEVDFAEGLEVGYRWYTARNTTPLFCFGHGVGYADFAYFDLAVSGALSAASPAASVSFTLALGGGGAGAARAGAEVAQLYVAGLPGDPPMGLKGFQYAALTPAAPSARVSIALALRDLSYWSPQAHAHLPYPPGEYKLWVGSSSCDLRLAGSVTVSA